MVKTIYCEQIFDAEHRVGQFLSKDDYDTLIVFDCDIYAPSIDKSKTEQNVIAKFRKNWFTKEEQELAYEGLRGAATESQNRGQAAGPRGDILGVTGRGGREWVTPYQLDILEFLLRPLNQLLENDSIEEIKKRHSGKPIEDTRGFVWKIDAIRKDHKEYYGFFENWLKKVENLSRKEQIKEAELVKKKYISETNYAQSVMSGVAGYYGRYPRIPWGRITSYTEKNPDKFKLCFPFLRKLDKGFKELLPERWARQKAACNRIDKRFVIDTTVFTTLTVNYNWRTAAHYDAGDLGEGFSNLAGISKTGWKGAELVLPQYKAAIKLEAGDLLLVANHTAIHGNLPFVGEDNDRISVVAYFREDMLQLKSFEYEQLRKQFITERAANKKHPDWKPLWNGVSPGVWSSEEWKQYLIKNNMKDEDGIVEVNKQSLESFFN